MSEWISVNDRIPESIDRVLTWHPSWGHLIGYHDMYLWVACGVHCTTAPYSNNQENYDEIPTHWMPLPEPPNKSS